MQWTHLLAAGLLSGTVSAKVAHARRDVDCLFATTATNGDTCESFADSWGMSLDDLKALNPGISCPDLGTTNEYCVIGEVTGDPAPVTSAQPSSTTSKISTIATTSIPIPTTGPNPVSTDGSCGGTTGSTCSGSPFGTCCSQHGYCGSTTDHCGSGCNPLFGECKGIAPGEKPISTDGTCGGTAGFTCADSSFGTCCSQGGWCGASTDHCGAGCNPLFGSCSGTAPGSNPISTDGTCGGTAGFTCADSSFGTCCSQSGWCGITTDHCGAGCNPLFGTCPGQSSVSSVVVPPTTSSSSIPKTTSIPQTSSVAKTSSIVKTSSSTKAPATTTTPGNGISTPTPIQPGMVSNCNKFRFVAKGSTCGDVLSSENISLEDFAKWNPQVKSDCSGLWAEVNVCVSIIGGTTSTKAPTTMSTKASSTVNKPSTTTSAGNGISTPLPTQPGMVTNCKKFHYVSEGNTCSQIYTFNKITLAQFVKWNTGVGSDCSKMWAKTYVCVGV